MKRQKQIKFIIKYSLPIIVMLFSLTQSVNAKNNNDPKSGQITYEIKYDDLSVKYFLFKSMLPKKTVTIFNNDNYRQKTLSSFLTITVYSDVKNENVSLITNVDGDKFHLKQSFETYKSQLNMKLYNEYKTIKGFKCRKATFIENEKMITIYYTTDINANDPVLLANNIKGCVLEKISRLKNNGGISIMTVSDIQYQDINADEFIIPTDIKTFSDINEFNRALDKY